MLMGNIQGMDIQIPHEVAQYWGWFLAFGIALVVLGFAAVVRSVTATIIGTQLSALVGSGPPMMRANWVIHHPARLRPAWSTSPT